MFERPRIFVLSTSWLLLLVGLLCYCLFTPVVVDASATYRSRRRPTIVHPLWGSDANTNEHSEVNGWTKGRCEKEDGLRFGPFPGEQSKRTGHSLYEVKLCSASGSVNVAKTLLRGAFLRITSDLSGGTVFESIKTRVTTTTEGPIEATRNIIKDGGVLALWTVCKRNTIIVSSTGHNQVLTWVSTPLLRHGLLSLRVHNLGSSRVR